MTRALGGWGGGAPEPIAVVAQAVAPRTAGMDLRPLRRANKRQYGIAHPTHPRRHAIPGKRGGGGGCQCTTHTAMCKKNGTVMGFGYIRGTTENRSCAGLYNTTVCYIVNWMPVQLALQCANSQVWYHIGAHGTRERHRGMKSTPKVGFLGLRRGIQKDP